MTARLVDGRSCLHLACQLDLDDVAVKMLQKSAQNEKELEEAKKKQDKGEDVEMKTQDDEVSVKSSPFTGCLTDVSAV